MSLPSAPPIPVRREGREDEEKNRGRRLLSQPWEPKDRASPCTPCLPSLGSPRTGSSHEGLPETVPSHPLPYSEQRPSQTLLTLECCVLFKNSFDTSQSSSGWSLLPPPAGQCFGNQESKRPRPPGAAERSPAQVPGLPWAWLGCVLQLPYLSGFRFPSEWPRFLFLESRPPVFPEPLVPEPSPLLSWEPLQGG